MDFGNVDVLGPQPRHLVSLVGGGTRQAGLVELAVHAAGEAHAGNLDRTRLYFLRQFLEIFLRAQQRCRSSIADRRAHGAGQRIRHRPILQHRLGRHLEAVLRLFVQGAVVVVLGGPGGDLLLRGTVLPHVPLGLHGIGVHEDGAIGPGLELRADQSGHLVHLVDQPLVLAGDVALVEEPRRALGRIGAEQLLDADAEGEFVRTRQHVLPGAHEGGRGRRTGVLDVEHRHALGEKPLLDQWLEKCLGTDRILAPEAHAAVAHPARLDVGACLHAGIRKRPEIGLAREVAEAHARVLLEGRGVGTDDIDVAHGSVSSGWLSGHLSVSNRPALGERTWP